MAQPLPPHKFFAQKYPTEKAAKEALAEWQLARTLMGEVLPLDSMDGFCPVIAADCREACLCLTRGTIRTVIVSNYAPQVDYWKNRVRWPSCSHPHMQGE